MAEESFSGKEGLPRKIGLDEAVADLLQGKVRSLGA